MSRREILDAAFAMLSGTGAAVVRNAALPSLVPDGGLVIMRDGEHGDPTQFMGGAHLLEHYNHAVRVEIYSASATPEAEIYDIANEIGATARADRTLGGLVEAVSVSACEVDAIPIEDGAPQVVGIVTLTLRYTLEIAA